MARILAIDYGIKRTGLAVTDPLKIIASPLETVPTDRLIVFLKSYLESQDVDALVLGYPTDLKNEDTHVTSRVREFKLQLEKKFPDKPVHLHDEKFTSKLAFEAMIAGGMKKKDRRQKGNVDKISATIILQSYLESNQ